MHHYNKQRNKAIFVLDNNKKLLNCMNAMVAIIKSMIRIFFTLFRHSCFAQMYIHFISTFLYGIFVIQ